MKDRLVEEIMKIALQEDQASADSQLERVMSVLAPAGKHTRNKDGAIFLSTYLREALPVAFTAPILPTDVLFSRLLATRVPHQSQSRGPSP